MQTGRAVVGVIDYQAGNIRSILNALDHLGALPRRITTINGLVGLSHLILPGVGAFGFCADKLRASGLLAKIEQWTLVERRPILGICVGMQLLADVSDELGQHKGLGWGGGRVQRLIPTTDGIRIPHVGWNAVSFEEDFGEYRMGDTADFYFDHSYAYRTPTLARSVALCTHGETFCAVIRRDNLVATQFHPEKSQAAGMRLLRSFLAI
jgi:imidazole glycerol-phosphate synthase subunit HisH